MRETFTDTQEAEIEEEFNLLLGSVGFSRIELQSNYRNKKFVDLGCGGGEFINRLLHHGITNEAYGVDQNPNAMLSGTLSADHFVHADFLKVLPDKVHNADVVTAMNSMSFLGLIDESLLEEYDHILSLLKPGGEFRTNVGFLQTDEGLKNKATSLEKISVFCQQRGPTFECKTLKIQPVPPSRREASDPDPLIREDCVIIIHKPKE
jgi:SAM-dependent methyltransferase